jgi:histidinol dehydrogenase
MRAGVTEFYPIGGAQAVAALAYGAGRLKPVDKIVGPGNAYVAAAKRIVFGDVGIDTIAGPSEITVVGDNQNSSGMDCRRSSVPGGARSAGAIDPHHR